MRDEMAEALTMLRDELDVATQRLAAVPHPASGTGSDRSGAVTITVGATGRVTDVAIAQRWRALVGIEGMSAAVREAVSAASETQLSAWAEAVDQTPTTGPACPRPLQLPHESLGAQLAVLTDPERSGERRRAALEELLTALEAAERSLDAAVRLVEARETSCYTGVSNSGGVMVSVNGNGDVTAVRIELRWLNSAREVTIERNINAAFRAAYQDLDSASDSCERRVLHEFTTLARDPKKLAQRLYLRDD